MGLLSLILTIVISSHICVFGADLSAPIAPAPVTSAAALAGTESALALANKYILELSGDQKALIKGSDEMPARVAFQALLETIDSLRESHSGVENKLMEGEHHSYGFSFFDKNDLTIDAIGGLLGGKSTWKKDIISNTQIAVADVGCGLGVGALRLIASMAKTYVDEDWHLAHPTVIDLYDLNPNNQPALRSLATLVNLAFPEFFRVSTAAVPYGENKYNIICSLNTLHYIPEQVWPVVMRNFQVALKKGGLLFLSTDHYLASVYLPDEVGAYTKAAQHLPSPFSLSLLPIGRRECAFNQTTHVLNFNLKLYLKEASTLKPGEFVTPEQLNLAALEEIIVEHMKRFRKRTVCIFDPRLGSKTEVPLKQIMTGISSGEFIVKNPNYAFDDALLQRAVSESLGADHLLTPVKMKCSKKVFTNKYGLPANVVLVLHKK